MRSRNAQAQWERPWIPFEVETELADGSVVVDCYSSQTRLGAAHRAREDHPSAQVISVAGTRYDASGPRIKRQADGERG